MVEKWKCSISEHIFFSMDPHYLVANQDIKNPLWHFLELIVL